MVYCMLSSNNLKVDDENTVLSFVHNYTKLLPLAKGIMAANELAKCLRYNFLSMYNIVSALRRNEALQLSEVFVDSVMLEYKERLKLDKSSQ
jgi:hypothetical protein